MRRALAIGCSALAIGCSALRASGCGEGGEETTATSFAGPDPAGLTPPDAPLFAESVVRPEGDQKAALQAALSKLLATDDPAGFIVQQLDRALTESNSGLTYTQDIEPWLGQRAGIFFETFTEEADGAAVVATTDPEATRRAIDKAAAADKVRERTRSYKGFDYEVDRDGTAAGIVGDFLVAGTEKAFRDAVDASNGDSLAASGGFEAQLDQAPDDKLAFLFVDPQAVADALRRSGQLTAGQLRSAGPQLQALLSQPAVASISSTSEQLAFEASTAASDAAPAPEESELLRDFPADSWVAFGAADAGSAFGQGFAQGATTGASQALRFDLGSQLGHWAGDVGGFVRGTSLFGLGGALVLESKDEQASARTLGDLQDSLSGNPSVSVSPLSAGGEQGFSLSPAGVPIQIQFVQRDGKVVAGLGSESVDDVFSPGSTLDDADSFDAVAGALGGDFAPVAFIDFEPLFQLVEGLPQAADDPDYQRAKPYLDHLDYLAAGARAAEGRSAVRVVLGLREDSSDASGSQAPASVSSTALAP